MSKVACMFLFGAAIVVSAYAALATQSKEITITTKEPAVISLADLFQQADIVALVKTVSGDTENYDVAVYKSHVITSFKGAQDGEDIYFGPYIGERLGWEYIVFLRRDGKPLVPKAASRVGYGTIRYAQIFNEGYSAMMTSYECVFNGEQKCGKAVKVCTDYIVLPKLTAVFPPAQVDTPFGCRWVKRPDFISMLASLANSKK